MSQCKNIILVMIMQLMLLSPLQWHFPSFLCSKWHGLEEKIIKNIICEKQGKNANITVA